MLRVVYYTLSSFLDLALPFIAETSRLVELHVLLEIHPGAWKTNMFDLAPMALPAGVLPAQPVLERLPAGVQACFAPAASVQLAVFAGQTSVSPANWAAAYRAARAISTIRPDVLHLEGTTGRIVSGFPALRRLPLVLTIHDPLPHSGEAPWRKILLRRILISRARRFILHNSAQVDLFCTHYRVSREAVDVVPLGVYDLFWQWAASPIRAESGPGHTVLFFGRLSRYKGLEVLYEAAPKVCQQVPGAHFVVAGRPVPGYRLPPAPSLPNGGRIDVIDHYLRNEQVAKLFQDAAVVACPYIDGTQSGVVLTAYAFGKPVVATRVGGLPEYVTDGETGMLIPPNSPEALAAALVDMLRQLAQPACRERFQERIAARSRTDLAWDRIAQQTLGVYHRAAGHGK